MKTCSATLDALCDGGPLPAAVLEHARHCASCTALLRADNVLSHQPTPQAPPISPALRAAIQQGGAVRPFSPWRAVMPWAVTASLLTMAGILSTRHQWNPTQVLATFTLCLATAVAGVLLVSRGPLGLGVAAATRWAAVVGAFVLLQVAHALVVDPSEAADEFSMQHHLGCLRAGVMASLVCALPLVWALRRSAAVSPASTGALLGAASALPALTMLALACPVRESIHLLVFHAAVALVGVAAGWVGGRRVVAP